MRVVSGLLGVFLFQAAIAGPQAGQPDPGFGSGGSETVAFDLGGVNDDIGALVSMDSHGRLYLVGPVALDGADTCLGVVRFSAAGAIDPSYADGGVGCHAPLPGNIELVPTDATVLPDGRLVVAGADALTGLAVVCSFDGKGDIDAGGFGSPLTPGCVRLEINVLFSHPNGAPDLVGLVDLAVQASTIFVAIQVVHAQFDTPRVRLARLSTAGNLLPFGQQASVAIFPAIDASKRIWLSELAPAASGRLLVTGAWQQPDDDGSDFYVARIDAQTGALDLGFADGGIRVIGFDRGGPNDDVPIDIAELSQGRIVVAGSAETKHGRRPAVAMLTASGEFSASFNQGEPAVYDPCVFFFGTCRMHPMGIEALTQGRLLLGGYVVKDGISRNFSLRLLADGSPDASYGVNFPGQTGYVAVPAARPQRARSLMLQKGKAVLGGWEDRENVGARDFLIQRLED